MADAPNPTPNPRPIPSIVTGVRDPGTTTAQRIIADVQDEILLYMPSAAPLTTLSGMMRKKRETTQYAYDWLEKDEFPRSVTLAATPSNPTTDTSLSLTAGQGVRVAVNFVLRNRTTGEHVLVTNVSTDTITVTRGIGNSGTGTALASGQVFDFLRAVYPDGSGIGTMKSIKEDRKFNYTEIVRTPFGFTGRQMNTDMYGGKDPMTEKKWHGIEHAKSLENAMFFGKRDTSNATGTIRSYTGGLEYFIATNIWDLNGLNLTERAFVEYLEFAMKWGRGGSNERGGDATKYLFCSRSWLTEIEFFAKPRIQYRPIDKRIGLKAGFYDTAHGTVVLVMTPILDGAHADKAFLVDMNHIRYCYHQGRDTKLLDNRQANDIDGESFEFMTDFGAQIELEAAHGILKGLPT